MDQLQNVQIIALGAMCLRLEPQYSPQRSPLVALDLGLAQV